jgi:hypothetical protein
MVVSHFLDMAVALADVLVQHHGQVEAVEQAQLDQITLEHIMLTEEMVEIPTFTQII